MMDLDAIKPISQKNNDNTDYNYNGYEDYAGQTSSNNTVKKVEQDNNVKNNIDSDKKDDGISQKSQDDGRENQQNVSKSTIDNSFAETNAKIKMKNTRLEYSIDDDTQRISIKVIDRDTDKCIREVPPEETLKALKKIWEIAGIIVDEKR